MTSTQTAVYVTDSDGRQDELHYVMRDGVSVLPNGALLLTYNRDEKGSILEGHIYAPGCWKYANIQQEEI